MLKYDMRTENLHAWLSSLNSVSNKTSFPSEQNDACNVRSCSICSGSGSEGKGPSGRISQDNSEGIEAKTAFLISHMMMGNGSSLFKGTIRSQTTPEMILQSQEENQFSIQMNASITLPWSEGRTNWYYIYFLSPELIELETMYLFMWSHFLISH